MNLFDGRLYSNSLYGTKIMNPKEVAKIDTTNLSITEKRQFVCYVSPVDKGPSLPPGSEIICISTKDAINRQRYTAALDRPGFVYQSDDEALDDFIAVHWATLVDLPFASSASDPKEELEKLIFADLEKGKGGKAFRIAKHSSALGTTNAATEEEMNSRNIVIYHGNCPDGFGAAWCFYHAGSLKGINYEFHAGIYQDPPPDVTDAIVYLVDFSYKRPIVEEMLSKAKKVYLIDHHKSALEDLASLEAENFIKFTDMNRSGAGLAWDFLFPGSPRPALINIIEDRDLWRFKFPNTKEICAGLFAKPYDFVLWNDLMYNGTEELRKAGEAINEKFLKDLNEFLPLTSRYMALGSFFMKVANVPYMWASEAGNLLANEHSHGVAATYFDTVDHRVFSLRSVQKGEVEIDVSLIAQKFGGGGHKNAAGFKVPRDHTLALF